MMNYKKTKQMAVPSQNVEVDPRSKTTADQAYNNIPTGDKEKVRGTKRMLAEKKKIATWY
jgi:acyl-homoserine lactone acylase PvdQ|tara:strand:- start:19 stop:198 length:180 start_codon:yes stop_codon:yes gene_type:complete